MPANRSGSDSGQIEFALIQSATARPITGPESSWVKCEPDTVTSVWFCQLRQKSLTAPIKIAPGSALTNSFGISLAAIHCEGEAFLGTASVIASDLAERPQPTPWVAAVWVDPQARQRDAGAALVGRATLDCFALGVGHVGLCVRP
jgi:hypothetical protein